MMPKKSALKSVSRSDGTAQLRARLDGIVNVLTGLGTARDRTQHNKFALPYLLDRGTLDFIYRGNGFGHRVIELPIREMIRQWFEIEGDPDGFILKALKKIQAKQKLADLLRWGHLYGGAIAVVGIDDGGSLDTPLNENNIQEVGFINVYDRHQLWWTTEDLYSDPEKEAFGTPEWYTVTPYHGATVKSGETQFRVHASRTLRAEGATIPELSRWQNLGWSDSKLQVSYESVRNATAAFDGIAVIVEGFETTVLQIKNLMDIVASGNDDELQKRLEILDMGRHILNTLILAEGEQFDKKSSSVAGIPELIDRSAQRIAADTGIPVTLLMGQAPAGLQATGASDIRFFYDNVKCSQEDELNPLLEPIVRWCAMAKKGKMKLAREAADELLIKHNPLWQLTETEQADLREKQARVDSTYIMARVLNPAQVAIDRFGGDKYSTETTIDETVLKEQLAVEQEEATKTPEEKAAEMGAMGGAPNGGPPGNGGFPPKPEERTEA